LQGSVATDLRCRGIVNNHIKKGLLLSLPVKKVLKSVNIWPSYKQEGGCLVHFVRRANTPLKVEESARHNSPFARNNAKYSPKKFTGRLNTKPLLSWLLTIPLRLFSGHCCFTRLCSDTL